MVETLKLPTIVTVNQQKGGAGKSTVTKNLTTYLALNKNKRVLNIDGDYSLYLTTNLYNVYEKQGNIGDLFTLNNLENGCNKDVQYYTVHPNIDLIVGDPHLNEKQRKLTSEDGTSFILMKWLMNHTDKVSEYDYIVIDTHNDFDIFTKNAIAISDVVLAPLDPSEKNESITTRMEYELHKLEKQLVEPLSDKSYVDVTLYTIGNKIAKNTASHREFLNSIQQRDDYLTWFPQKELFVKASKEIKTMEDMMKADNNKHDIFYKQYLEAMEHIYNVININEN
ncbi:ParA family protein [Staphylococcus epidermidis]|nr:ParA family protein [Staphylococcus epidermidis]MBM6209905.1 ParA family protein [Staphylococcus epidermidis]MBM6212248.1 ParA family protein [Staphylococcus epidermidis]MBM6219212.1 ParA family protein [Staphylococcus epidermidis]MBM6223811.1 ParA family protein [Staphylococcus epidermidis]